MIAALLFLAASATTPVPAPAPPAPPIVRTIKLPGTHIPTEISQHAGALWFVSWQNWPRKVEPFFGRINVKGTIRLREVLNGSRPGLMTRAGDGTLWLTDRVRLGFWRVRPDGSIVRIRADRTAVSVAASPDGALWCTHPDSSDISRYDVDGTLRGRWAVPSQKGVQSRPNWIVLGPDASLWFSDAATHSIGRINAGGTITVFPLPKGWRSPGELAARRDAVWFTIGNHPLLGKITPGGVISSVKIHASARVLASGPEGRIWYSDGGSEIGWVNDDGTADFLIVSETPGKVRSMAAGPDDAMWFVDEKARTVGRVELPAKP